MDGAVGQELRNRVLGQVLRLEVQGARCEV